MFLSIQLDRTEREIDFPFQVQRVGMVKSFRQKPTTRYYDNLEFCLRLTAEKEPVCDEIDGKMCQSFFPQLLVKKPGMLHRFSYDDRREAIFFEYSPKTSALMAEKHLVPDEPIQKFELTGELRARVDELRGLIAHSQEFSIADKIDLCCFAIVEGLLFLRKLEGGRHDELRTKLLRVVSFMQMNLEHRIDIADVAKQFGMSERNFFRSWKQCFGITPNRYLMDERIRRARYLLDTTGQSVTEIAMGLAFCDDNYFATVFKRAAGCTPTEYRRRGGESKK